MEIKRTEKAIQISETQNSETNSASSKKVSTLSTSDSYENASSNQPMFAAPQPESPLSKTSESLEKQFNATRMGQSMVGTSSPQPVSRANDKQGEFTKAYSEFQETVKAHREEALHQAVENALDDLRSGNSSILGGEFSPVHIPLLDHHEYNSTTNTENSKPEPVLKLKIDEQQKFFNELLDSNRTKPTSSVQDERVKNVKDHNNVQDFYPSTEPTSRANDKQAEFTEAKAGFEKTVEEERRKDEIIGAVTDLINDPYQALNDLLSGIDPLKEEESIPIAESNHKQKQLTDLLAANKEALKK